MDRLENLSKLSDADVEAIKSTWNDFTYVDGMTLKDVFCFGVGCGRALAIFRSEDD